jgi:hypothetical protein
MESSPLYITVPQAARILDCEEDRILELLHDHVLRARHENGALLIRQEDIADVHRLKMIGIKPSEAISKLLFLEKKVERLDATVNMLLEINNLGGSRFHGMSDNDLHELYTTTVTLLGEESWATDRMLQLCEVFIKITEVEIEKLNEILALDNCWLPFYRLALRMTRYVGTHDSLETNFELQKIRDLLYSGRKNLQMIAVLFISQKAAIGPSRKLLAELAATDIEAFDVLIKQARDGTKK